MAGAHINLWQTYQNLKELCEFRGATIKNSENDQKLFTAKIESDPCITILAERPQSDLRGAATILVAQITPRMHGEAPNKYGLLADKLIKNTPSSAVLNIIFVFLETPNGSILSNLAQRNSPIRIIECHRANLFSIVVPRNISVPRHTIATNDEVDSIKKMYIAPSSFPHLIASGEKPDPMVVWMGFRPGMIIRVDRPCETSGYETVFRLCV